MLNRCNVKLRLINQAQMRKKFPKGFGKTNNIISRLLSHNKITPTNNQTIGLQAAPNSAVWSNLADECWHLSFQRLCLSNLCNQCALCLRPPHVCRRACSVRWGLRGETALSRHHDSLISCPPIIVVLQHSCVLRFLIKIRTVQWKGDATLWP